MPIEKEKAEEALRTADLAALKPVEEWLDEKLLQGVRVFDLKVVPFDSLGAWDSRRFTMLRNAYKNAGWELTRQSGDQRDPYDQVMFS